MIRRLAWIGSFAWLLAALPAAAATKLEYNRDVRPILSEQCFACHGPDSAARKADLRLDRRDAVVESGIIVPGDPDNSELIARVSTSDPKLLMPPKDSHKKLSPADKQTLRRWIAEGAEYQPHWAYIAPQRAEPPKVKNPKWARTTIDHFVLAELEERGLEPAPEADVRTLARRLALDLTGLPPKPEDVEALVRASSPSLSPAIPPSRQDGEMERQRDREKAYEAYVDRLLASPQWGEHRGRYWLDAARYADTHGIHFDNFREMWTYRDWVINAFNSNQPFDRFTIEQLAGDLLPDASNEQRVASGFNRCNITSNEGGLIDEEYLVLYTRDRTETTAQVWMGMTAGCAVCHDHKFDPLSQREFYEMAAFFNNTTQAAKDGNIKDTPPIIVMPKQEDAARWAVLPGEISLAATKPEARKKAARAEFDQWLETATVDMVNAQMPSKGLQLAAALDEGKGNVVHATINGKPTELKLAAEIASDRGPLGRKALKITPTTNLAIPGVGQFDTKQAFSAGAWIKFAEGKAGGAIIACMDKGPGYRGWDLWLDDGKLATHILSQWPDKAIKVTSKTKLKPGPFYHVFVTYNGSGRAAGVKLYVNGEPQQITPPVDRLGGESI
ncbi:MAG TPA: DUF1549 domain-containing protein, partial [Pirellulales bacterium]|nr:DUF1549 domain-containing protein [Pirellulales bacterium]